MGKIKKFFNRIFGRRTPVLTEAIVRDIPNNIPLEQNNNFEKELQENTIDMKEINLNEIVDLFINEYKLGDICQNPRGKNLIKENLTKSMEEFFMGSNAAKETFKLDTIEKFFKETFGEIPVEKTNTISFKESGQYLWNDRINDQRYETGVKVTTLSLDEKNNLTLREQGRYEYDKTEFEPNLHYYDNTRTFEESGIEMSRKYNDLDLKLPRNQIPNAYDLNSDNFGPLNDSINKREYSRLDGLSIQAIKTKDGKTKFSYGSINTQYGADDLVASNGAFMTYDEFQEHSKNRSEDEYKKWAKASIDKSKYKKALVAKTPGIEENDIGELIKE